MFVLCSERRVWARTRCTCFSSAVLLMGLPVDICGQRTSVLWHHQTRLQRCTAKTDEPFRFFSNRHYFHWCHHKQCKANNAKASGWASTCLSSDVSGLFTAQQLLFSALVSHQPSPLQKLFSLQVVCHVSFANSVSLSIRRSVSLLAYLLCLTNRTARLTARILK